MTLLCYAHLCWFLWRRPAVVGSQTRDKVGRARSRKRRTIAILLSIVCSLVIGWAPLFLRHIFTSYRILQPQLAVSMQIVGSISAVVSVSLTPVLYLLNDSFRGELVQLFQYLRRGTRGDVSNRKRMIGVDRTSSDRLRIVNSRMRPITSPGVDDDDTSINWAPSPSSPCEPLPHISERFALRTLTHQMSCPPSTSLIDSPAMISSKANIKRQRPQHLKLPTITVDSPQL